MKTEKRTTFAKDGSGYSTNSERCFDGKPPRNRFTVRPPLSPPVPLRLTLLNGLISGGEAAFSRPSCLLRLILLGENGDLRPLVNDELDVFVIVRHGNVQNVRHFLNGQSRPLQNQHCF